MAFREAAKNWFPTSRNATEGVPYKKSQPRSVPAASVENRADSAYNSPVLCELCQCDDARNLHHLIPRTVHSNKWFKKRFTREEMAAGIDVCRQCHRAIHDLISNEKELGRNCHSLEKLLAHPEIAKYVAWKQSRAQ